jgi:general nucleoside transport system ATP-binding protein
LAWRGSPAADRRSFSRRCQANGGRGATPSTSARVPSGRFGPNARRRLRLLTAPEERLGHAAAPDLTLAENPLLSGRVRRNLTHRGFLRFVRIEAFARETIRSFDVRTPGTNVKAAALPGGNLQKFLIGREVLQAPAILVVNQPTWGVDAGAAKTIRGALIDLARQGSAVLVISQDLDEIFEIADRIAVISEGRLSAARPAEELTAEEIGLLMGGIHGERPGEAVERGDAA